MNTNFTKENDKDNVILFLHGWGCDSEIFAPITTLMYHSTNLRVDLWGFGKSQSPPCAWDVIDYARQLKIFLKGCEIDKCHVVAHSFGGRVAIAFACLYPDMVQKMVLFSSAGLKRFSLVKTIKQTFHKIAKKFDKNRVAGSLDFRATPQHLKGTFIKVVNQDLTKYAKQISAPTLLVYGKKDSATPLWMGKKLHRLIKNSKLIVTKGDHFEFATNVQKTADLIEDFIFD